MIKLKIVSVIISLYIIFIVSCTSNIPRFAINDESVVYEEELRIYQHGIDVIQLPDGKYSVFFSSNGNPPNNETVEKQIWLHDIYYTIFDIKNLPKNIGSECIKLTSFEGEGQEPVSAAINTQGKIFIVTEDGRLYVKSEANFYGITGGGWECQSYGLFNYDNSILYPAKTDPYPQLTIDPNLLEPMGHGGHVASYKDKFIVFFGNDWVQKSGINDYGSGNDSWVGIYDENAEPTFKTINISKGMRDWWMQVACSKDGKALLLCQRFVKSKPYAKLVFSMFDLESETFSQMIDLSSEVKYYTYSISYLENINRFFILGSDASNEGFAYLLDTNGNIVDVLSSIPPIPRESQSIVFSNDDNTSTVVTPIAPSGISVFSISESSINNKGTIDDSYNWQSMGTDGLFIDSNNVLILALSKKGLVQKEFNISSIR